MTTFNAPVYIGKNTTGDPLTSPIGFCVVSTYIASVSAGRLSSTVVVPENSVVTGIQMYVVSAVAGIAAGVTVRAGTAASPSLYGTISVSAEKSYSIVLTKQVLTNPTSIIIDATAQASAADLTGFKTVMRVTYGTKF